MVAPPWFGYRGSEVVIEMEEKDVDDERREAAIASAVSLQSNFKPRGGVSSAQLSKFQVFAITNSGLFYVFRLDSDCDA